MKFELISDGRMASFESCETYDLFLKKMLPTFWFNKNVPSDVLDSIRVIRKLIEASYFEYEFCDVAALKAALIFEMALKIRYHDLTNETWNIKVKNQPKRDLANLIKWTD